MFHTPLTPVGCFSICFGLLLLLFLTDVLNGVGYIIHISVINNRYNSLSHSEKSNGLVLGPKSIFSYY